jgi:phosphoglycolate phosphatase
MMVSDLIFDLDGTLIDSAPSILASMKQIVAEAGYNTTLELDSSLIGPPLSETLARITGLSNQTSLSPLIEAFKLRYDESGVLSTTFFTEIPAVLRQFRERGTTLHLATNKRMVPTRAIIDLFGWSEYFTSIYTLDMEPNRHASKADMLGCQLREQGITPSRAAYIGDTRADGLAAEANGLHFIAANWGYGDFDDWAGTASWSRALHPEALLDQEHFRSASDAT